MQARRGRKEAIVHEQLVVSQTLMIGKRNLEEEKVEKHTHSSSPMLLYMAAFLWLLSFMC